MHQKHGRPLMSKAIALSIGPAPKAFLSYHEVALYQCDQIGRFFKVLGNKISSKRSPNDWQLFGLF